MQNNSIHILSTRALDESLIQKAASINITVDTENFIETTPLVDEDKAAFIHTLSTQSVTVLFTSMNAVTAIAPYVTTNTRWRIYCIGHATKTFSEKYLPHAEIAGTAAYAEELAKLIISNKEKQVYFFCGNIRRDVLPAALAAHQIDCKETVAYTTSLVTKNISRQYDGILFFSPSAVESFFSANQLPATTVVFAIGKTTAEAASGFTSNKIISANETSKEALLQTAIAYFRSEHAIQ